MAVTIDQGPQDAPDMIVPHNEAPPKRSFGEHISHIVKAFTTKEGLVGDYDYGEQP
jgi:uric acid-xanthine permease